MIVKRRDIAPTWDLQYIHKQLLSSNSLSKQSNKPERFLAPVPSSLSREQSLIQIPPAAVLCPRSALTV